MSSTESNLDAHGDSHIDPDTVALIAIGEAAGDAADIAHLLQCEQCADEIRSLRRAATVGRSAALEQPLLSPGPQVWEKISAELGFDAPVTAESGQDAPLSSESRHVAPRRAPRRTRRGRRMAVVLTSLSAVVVATLVVIGVWAIQRDDAPAVTVVAAATLEGFPDHPGAVGEATLDEQGGIRSISVTLDADVTLAGYREVWLLASDGSGLISLGVLDGRTGTFPVPGDADLELYSIVDISQERSDGDPGHSGDSIVRGALESL